MLACGVTWYFYRQNIKGMHESSDKAMKIMQAHRPHGRHHDRLVPGHALFRETRRPD